MTTDEYLHHSSMTLDRQRIRATQDNTSKLTLHLSLLKPSYNPISLGHSKNVYLEMSSHSEPFCGRCSLVNLRTQIHSTKGAKKISRDRFGQDNDSLWTHHGQNGSDHSLSTAGKLIQMTDHHSSRYPRHLSLCQQIRLLFTCFNSG